MTFVLQFPKVWFQFDRMKFFVMALSLSLASFAHGDLEVRPNGLGVDIVDKPGKFSSSDSA